MNKNELRNRFQSTTEITDGCFTMDNGNLTGFFNSKEKFWDVSGDKISFKVYVETPESAARLAAEEAAKRMVRDQQKLEAA